MSDLSPTTHLIHSIYHDTHFSNHGAFAEMIDNAFEPSKGDAKKVRILLGQKYIEVYDDGKGVDDINRLFQMGNTSSMGNNDIGKFGVGCTNSCIWLAYDMLVETVYEGRYYWKYVNWEECEQTGSWPEKHDGLPQQPEHAEAWINAHLLEGFVPIRRGTRITLVSTRRARPKFRPLCKMLSELFAVGIRNGKKIFVGTADDPSVKLLPFQPPQLRRVVRFEGEINGKRYSGKAGQTEQGNKAYNKCFYGFGHRTICSGKGPWAHTGLQNIYCEVDLGPGWKHSLSRYKDGLSDADEQEQLDLLIRGHISELLDAAIEERDSIEINSAIDNVADLFNEAWLKEGRGLRMERAKPSDEETETEGGDGSQEAVEDPEGDLQLAEGEEDGDRKSKRRVGVIQVAPCSDENLGGRKYKLERIPERNRLGFTVKIFINKDDIVSHTILVKPQSELALFRWVSMILATECAADEEFADKMFPGSGMADDEEDSFSSRVAHYDMHVIGRIPKAAKIAEALNTENG